uniref:Polysaccharide biosynthesis C-terminal domain-containing protein n=1 Tax=Prevotella sp. GTC17260 TaxID=3236796 RepID=A0AB33JEJ7_9BACT
MANLKSLLKDTAIYGLSSIAARFINYLLVPIQVYKFNAAGGQYGIITNIYAYIALLIILLTYGMETTFFRFANKQGENAPMVYSTTLRMVGFVALVFSVLVLLFLQPISAAMGYADHPSFVGTMAVCVAIDAWTAIMFDYLRYKHRPYKFALLKIVNITLNIVLNLLYLVVLPYFKINPFGIYDAQFTLNVAFVFYINLTCTIVTLLMLWKELKGITFGFDKGVCKRMLSYTWPMLILGLAGQLNQSASQILFPYFYNGSIAEAQVELGIYGASIKIAMIMVMITQAFRFAYEPFVFGKTKDKDSKDTYAKVMKYYIIFTLLAFLMVMGYMDILRYVVAHDYWDGLRVVPIVMAAEIMFGIYFNLSFWYKLTDRTIWGAYFSGLGCVVLILMDILLIPHFSYMACAWAGFAAYGVSMVVSYVVGQRYYPINYPLKEILLYVVLTAVLFGGIQLASSLLPILPTLIVNTLLIGVFVIVTIKKENIKLKR